MIEKFEFINDQKEGVEIIYNLNDEIQMSFDDRNKIIYNSNGKGIRWLYKNKTIELFDEEYNIEGIPSINYLHIIVIYHKKTCDYPPPLDASILNPDGTIFKTLKLPKLISPLAAQYYKGIKYPISMYFESVQRIKINSKSFLTMKIGFNRDWWESRVINPETGEFGELLSSGMR